MKLLAPFVLTLHISFRQHAAGRRFVVEVKASDDRGNAQDWQRAGSLTVPRSRHR